MRTTKRASETSLRAALLLAALGVALRLAPDQATDAVRTAARDALRPGLWAVDRARAEGVGLLARWSGAEQSGQRIAALTEKLAAMGRRQRVLQLEYAELEAQLRQIPRDIVAPFKSDTAEPLFIRELLGVRVLGAETASGWRSGRLLDAGSSSGLREAAPVVRDERPLIDAGGDAQLTTEDRLFAGCCVVGKVHQVGRWTSTILLLTDPEFAGRAQLVRRTTRGPVFGAEGTLVGQGTPLCRLLFRGETPQSVQVGDDVYTAGRDGIYEAPMYYGRVVEAEFGVESSEWHVLVEPACDLEHLTSVSVLRKALNRERVAVND